MRDVEDADSPTHGGVFGEHAGAGVLDRHQPAAEFGHLGTRSLVLTMQR